MHELTTIYTNSNFRINLDGNNYNLVVTKNAETGSLDV